jgi:hypothetical protein
MASCVAVEATPPTPEAAITELERLRALVRYARERVSHAILGPLDLSSAADALEQADRMADRLYKEFGGLISP